MKISFLPKNPLSKLSVFLNIFFIIAIIALYFFSEVLRLVPIYLIRIVAITSFIASLTSFITGIISVAKNKDKSVSVYLTIIIGFLVILFIMSQIASAIYGILK